VETCFHNLSHSAGLGFYLYMVCSMHASKLSMKGHMGHLVAVCPGSKDHATFGAALIGVDHYSWKVSSMKYAHRVMHENFVLDCVVHDD